MSGKKGTKAKAFNTERRCGEAWAKNRGDSGGPKPKSEEKAARRKKVLDRQRTPVKDRPAA